MGTAMFSTRAPSPGIAKRILTLAVALFAGVTGGAIYLAVRGDTPTQEPAARDFMAIFDPSQPLLIPGIQTTIPQASVQTGYPLYRPPNDTPSEVWLSPSTGEVGLRYGTSLVLLYSKWPPGTDVASRYTNMVASWNAGYTATIAGHPAWVVPKGSTGPDSPRDNEVYVTIGNVEVALYGLNPLSDLLDKAASLQA